MNYKRQNGDASGELIFFLSLAVLGALILLGFKLWGYTHQSVWHAVIFWLCVAVLLAIVPVIKFWDDILFEIKWRLRKHDKPKQTANTKRDYSNLTQQENPKPDLDNSVKPNNPKWDYSNLDFHYSDSGLDGKSENVTYRPTEDSAITFVRQFEPRWIERNGKRRLEGGENGNNANLAQYLRDNVIAKVETEITLKNGSRADILINDEVVIECKPHLLSVEKLHSISGEIRRVKRIGTYKVYALIYGDGKSYLLEDLKADIGENNVIVLGEAIE